MYPRKNSHDSTGILYSIWTNVKIPRIAEKNSTIGNNVKNSRGPRYSRESLNYYIMNQRKKNPWTCLGYINTDTLQTLFTHINFLLTFKAGNSNVLDDDDKYL